MNSSISIWLKRKRMESGLELLDLARIAGSNAAQISRVETGRISLTLNFLIVLLWALKIDIDEFTSEFNLPKVVLPNISQPDENTTIKLDQLTSMLEVIPYTVTVLEFVKAYENAIPDAIGTLEEKLESAIKKEVKKSISTENLRHRLQAAILDGDLLPNPPGLTLEMLEHWFQEGGALTLADAGAYLNLIREQKKYTLEALAKLSGMTKSTINRFENALSDRFQFEDIVNLDRALQANGKILSMYWVVVMHQMGLWFSMKDTRRQPIKKGPASHLMDTFIKVTRWSYLYDDPNLPWIEPWIAPVVEVDNALQLVSAYIRGDQHDYLRLAEEIRVLMPYKVFLMEAGEYPGESASPDAEFGLRILHGIKQAIGDDVFGLRVLEMYQNNFNDPDYAAAFRVLLRELMVSDSAFFEKMKSVTGQER